MQATRLEREVDMKAKENQELTNICDELINKVGSWHNTSTDNQALSAHPSSSQESHITCARPPGSPGYTRISGQPRPGSPGCTRISVQTRSRSSTSRPVDPSSSSLQPHHVTPRRIRDYTSDQESRDRNSNLTRPTLRRQNTFSLSSSRRPVSDGFSDSNSRTLERKPRPVSVSATGERNERSQRQTGRSLYRNSAPPDSDDSYRRETRGEAEFRRSSHASCHVRVETPPMGRRFISSPRSRKIWRSISLQLF